MNFEEYLQEKLADPEFRKAWEAGELAAFMEEKRRLRMRERPDVSAEGMGWGDAYRCRECGRQQADREAATLVRSSRDRGRGVYLLCPDCRERVRREGRMRAGSPLRGARDRWTA